MTIIETSLRNNRLKDRRSLAVYLNCGDPSVAMTRMFIQQCAAKNIDVIELGVPFPNSFTDGTVVLRSHDRALQNRVELENVTRLVEEIRADCDIPIVLLTDFSYSVKPRGIKNVIEQVSRCGANGLLLLGLPPLFMNEYIEYAEHYGIDPILSLYPKTPKDKILCTLKCAKGFVYLVTQYGKSGGPIDFSKPAIHTFFTSVRRMTDLPLMAGFGIKNFNDLQNIFSTGAIDGAIMGSSLCNVIETALPDKKRILKEMDHYLQNIIQAKEICYGNQN